MTIAASMTLKRDALLPRRPDGIGRGLMLAIAVHIGLVIALAFGVHWRIREPETMSAELWAAVPQMAAPRAVEPPALPKLAPPMQPVPKIDTPPPAPLPDADIEIEKAQRKKEFEQQARQAEQEREEREERKRQAAAEKLAAQEKLERQAKERERQQQQLEAQKKKEEERAEAQRVAAREAQMKRIMGMANASGDERASGRALQSSGPSANYAGRIRARVKPNIVFTDDVSGNPEAKVEVRVAPDGTIVGTPRLLKSSGSKGWDDAVVRAVVKTETLPRDIDGTVPPSIEITFRPHE